MPDDEIQFIKGLCLAGAALFLLRVFYITMRMLMAELP